MVTQGAPPAAETEPVVLRIAASAADRDAVYRFRYRVYVEQMSRRQVYADHARRRMTMTTKLMVEPSLPRTPLPLRLIQFMADKFHYRHACLFDFLDCNKPLIPFFNKYGYVSYLGWVFHREYGTVRPMFCPACDVEHLSATGSPFLRAVKKYNVSHCVTSQRLRTLLAKA